MKSTFRTSLLMALCAVLLSINSSYAGGTIKTETFKVSGNCGMCKATIEGALTKKDGIVKKSWDPETKMLTVSYDPSKIELTEIKKKVAAVGYDTDEIKADDAAYDKLHGCCKYERAKE